MNNPANTSIRAGPLGVLLLLLLPGCGPLVLSVDDTVVMDGREARLVAHVGRQHVLGLRTTVERVPVSFSVSNQGISQNIADGDGRAGVTVQLPESGPLTFDVQAKVNGSTCRATGRIFYWHKGRVIIAVDIDHTISQTDYDKLLMTDIPQASPPLPDARETLAVLSKDYYIMYLTARPRFLLEKTRNWLAAYEFPPGPVVTAPKLSDSMQPTKWKSQALEGLRHTWPDVLIGIGNHNSDAESYAPNGMLPVIIYSQGEELHYADEVVLQHWEAVAGFFAANRATLMNPAKLRSVIEGRAWLIQPIIPWHEPKVRLKPKVRPSTVLDGLGESP